MTDLNKAHKLLDKLCECEDDIPVLCPMCIVADVLGSVVKDLGELKKKREEDSLTVESLVRSNDHLERQMKDVKKAISHTQKKYNRNIETLNFYWHQKNKACPCLQEDEDGNNLGLDCNSPHKSLLVTEEEVPIRRSEEVAMIDEFIAKHGVTKVETRTN